MSNEIISVIDALAAKFGIVIDWTSQNVMPLVAETLEQLIEYKTALNGVLVIVFLLGIITGMIGLVKGLIAKENEFLYETELNVPLAIFSFIIFTVSFIFIWFSLVNYLKLTFAPNIYILEYLKSML